MVVESVERTRLYEEERERPKGPSPPGAHVKAMVWLGERRSRPDRAGLHNPSG